MTPTTRLLALAIAAALSLPQHARATDAEDKDGKHAKTLDAVLVEGTLTRGQSTNQNATMLDADQLEDELAESMEDVIRYIPGVSVSDMGRFGDNGFNIRGIEGNRVTMTVDGLSMSEGVETSALYEFFRAGQGGVDIDSLKGVEIIKGADSITAGSGALGGAVLFTTKDPRNYLQAGGNDSYIGGKFGYTGHNGEKLGSLTVANRTGIVESMLVYTRRQAHESEGWYDDTAATTGSARRMPDPVEHDSTNILAKLDLALSDAHRLSAVYEYNRVDNLVENLSRVSPPAFFERWGDDDTARDRYGLIYAWSAETPAFDTLELRLDHQRTASHGITRMRTGTGSSANPRPGPNTTPCTPALPCTRAEDRRTDQTLDKLALDLDKSAGAHALAYGLAWQRREIDFTAIDYRWNNAGALDSATIDPAQVPGTEVKAWNLYLQDRLALQGDRLQLHLGVRYDRYDYTPTLSPTFIDNTGSVRAVSFAAPSWQTGIHYEIRPGHSLWAQAGRGFRAPTTAEMYAPTSTAQIIEVATGNSVTVPTIAANPDLAAETSLNLETGYRWQGAQSRFGISLFRDRYDDFIESVRVTRNPGTQYRTCAGNVCTTRQGYDVTTTANAGEVTVTGIELEGQWQLGEAWLLRTAWTHNRGEVANGRPLDSINPDRGVLGLSWQGLAGRLRVTGNLTHALAKDADDVDISPNQIGTASAPFLSEAYTVVDLFGSYRVNDHLRINAGLYNLFDERYSQWARIRNVSRGTSYLHGYATTEGIGRYTEPGRNLRVSVSWSF